MSEFENSAEAKIAKKIFKARQNAAEKIKAFMNGVQTLQGNIAKKYEQKKSRSSAAIRYTKMFLKRFKREKTEQGKQALSNIGKALTDAGRGVVDDFKQFGSDMKGLGGAMLETAKDGLSAGWEQAGKVVKPVAKATAHGFALAAGATIGGAVIAGKAGASALKSAYDFGKDTAQRVGEDFKQFGSDMKGLGGAMKEMAQEKAAVVKETYTAVKDKAIAKGKEFVAGAKVLQGKALNAYTATAIEMVGGTRAAVRGVKSAISNFGTQAQLKFEDKAYDAGKAFGKAVKSGKALWGRITKSLTSAKDTAHYGLLTAKDQVGKYMTDKIDTVHYGALVAGDKVKPVAKAALHGSALLAGATIGGAVLAGKAVGDFTKDTAQRVGEDFKQFGSDMKDLGGAMKEMAKDGLSAGWEKTSQVASKMGNEIGAATQELGGAMKTVVQGIGGQMKEDYQEIKGAIKGVGTKITTVGKEKAENFMNTANSVIKGGRSFGSSIMKAIRSGSDRALESVSHTLAATSTSITKGMEQVRAGIDNQARGSSKSWLRMGMIKMAGARE